MRKLQLAAAGLSALLLTASCGVVPPAREVPSATREIAAAEREAARYQVLETTSACTCTAATGSGGAQNASAFDTFFFGVVDNGAADLSNVHVFVGAKEYNSQSMTVSFSGQVVTISGTMVEDSNALPGPPTIEVTLTFDYSDGGFSLTIGTNAPVTGTGLGAMGPGDCELPDIGPT